ncbi:hypothetical protein KGD82_13640 [Nocardiopsis eucommiae]|uniref:Uncharacterized protein n=1 Tax=Nocardiopsis eucommiae TaxID=2831970 RepID=A0A975LD40_9ACTN|nr:hypothetical protein KGD82_13640 [Nocardiopsis eucommiae]
MDAETRRVIAGFQKEILRLNRKVDTLERGARTPQLSHSSIESGSLDVIDPETEEVRLRIGHLPDGTVGMITEGGDPPPRPSAPRSPAAPQA